MAMQMISYLLSKHFIIQPPDESHCLSSLLERLHRIIFKAWLTLVKFIRDFLEDSITSSG